MRVDELDYDLPPELIAQAPAADRAASRLLRFDRAGGAIEHRQFSDVPSLLRAGDLLVMNDARVTPARFTLVKPTGGRVEGLFVEQRGARRAIVMLKNLGPVRPEATLRFERDASAGLRVIGRGEGGLVEVELDADEPLTDVLARVGRMPLPPYIKRERGADARDDADEARYQTVYANAPGSIAAPTAGLHFTPQIFDALAARGVERTTLTLHVGLGTFKPVEAASLADHPMHVERFELPAEACETINRAKRDGRRVIAVGTTTARVLESQPAGELSPGVGETRLLIRPPYAWRRVDALFTNFHQPRSTLIALVAAFVGLDAQRRIYAEAIARRYRFFSYGDAMFAE